jgi:hypothetical protein
MKRIRLIASLLGVSLLVPVIWVASAQDVRSVRHASQRPEGRWDKVNHAAQNVRNGDRRAIQNLVDQVFLANGLDGYIAASASSVKERLVSAEVDFQNGTGEGIDTEKVATSVNQLVGSLKLPAYAATNADEVKKVRMRMLTIYPGMIGRGSAAKRNNSGPSFEARMSPVEAFHVAAILVQQKVFNPEFQLTPAERQKISRQSQTGRQLNRAAVTANSIAPNGERTRQMVAAIRAAGRVMSFRDMLDQSELSLDLLGIGR